MQRPIPGAISGAIDQSLQQYKPPEAVRRQTDDREFSVAKDVLEHIAKLHAGNPPSPEEFTRYCEMAYQWMMSEQWPPQSGRTTDQ